MNSKGRILTVCIILVFPVTFFWMILDGYANSLTIPPKSNQSNLDPFCDTSICINEIDAGNPDALELYNKGSLAIDLTDWKLIVNNKPAYTFTTFSLPPYSYVVIEEYGNTDDNTENWIYMGAEQNLDFMFSDGAVSIVDDVNTGIDFVRWGSSGYTPPTGTNWYGINPPKIPINHTLGRDPESTDTDDGDDWCLELPTLGEQNGVCNPVFIPLVIH